MAKLTLERRDQQNESILAPGVMMTPALDENYWSYRVVLTAKQAVLGFPKFTTIGIGFAVEEDDWNTNLPYQVDTEKIFRHIARNKGDDTISDDDVREAIRMIQRAARQDRDGEVSRNG